VVVMVATLGPTTNTADEIAAIGLMTRHRGLAALAGPGALNRPDSAQSIILLVTGR
jgi:hypothetical protein